MAKQCLFFCGILLLGVGLVESVKYNLKGQRSSSLVVENNCMNLTMWNITVQPDPVMKLKGWPYTQFHRGNPACEPQTRVEDDDGNPIYTFMFEAFLLGCGVTQDTNGTFQVTIVLPFRTDGIEVREDHLLFIQCATPVPRWHYNETVGAFDPAFTDFNPNKTNVVKIVPPEIRVTVLRNGVPLVPGAPTFLGETLTMRVEVIDPAGVFTKVKVQDMWATHDGNPVSDEKLPVVSGGCSDENIPGEAGVPVFENFQQISTPSVIETDFRVFRFAGKPNVHLFLTTTSCSRSEEKACEVGVDSVKNEPCPEPPPPPTTVPPPAPTTQIPVRPEGGETPKTPVEEEVVGEEGEESFIPVEPPEPTPTEEENEEETPKKGPWFEEIPKPTEWYEAQTENSVEMETHPNVVEPTEYYEDPGKDEVESPDLIPLLSGQPSDEGLISAFHTNRKKRFIQYLGQEQHGVDLEAAFSHQMAVGHIQLVPAQFRVRRDVPDDVLTDEKDVVDEPRAVSGMTSFYMSVYNPGEVPPEYALDTNIETGNDGINNVDFREIPSVPGDLERVCLSVAGTTSLSLIGSFLGIAAVMFVLWLIKKIREENRKLVARTSLYKTQTSVQYYNQPRLVQGFHPHEEKYSDKSLQSLYHNHKR